MKIKAVQREKFPVVDFIKDSTGVAALYFGKQEGRELRYMGKVGTVPHGLQSNQETARDRRQSENQADQAH